MTDDEVMEMTMGEMKREALREMVGKLGPGEV